VGVFARWARRLGIALTAVIAGLVVTGLVIDPGPSLRARAEREASRLIKRPLHIGRLSISILRGRFVFDDLKIEGLTPDARPFFTARRIVVRMPWWTILRREIFIEAVELSDWRMLVETFPDGRHSFISLPKRQPGPRRFVTTVQIVRATRGEFEYQDHGTPWSVVARNLDFTVARLLEYRGEARFRGGTVRIRDFEPMRADMFCTFTIDGAKVTLHRIDLATDGADSKVVGEVDLARWPEQIYEVNSTVQFAPMRPIFFARERFSLSGEGRFLGTFHLFKGGRELRGTFESAEAGLNDWRFPNLRGSLVWLPGRFEVTEAQSDFYGGRARFTYAIAPIGAATPAVSRFDASYESVDLARLTDFLELQGLRLAGRATGQNLLEWPLGRFVDRRGDGWVRADPPPGTPLMGATIPDELRAGPLEGPPETTVFDKTPLRGYLPVGGGLRYRYGPEWVEIEPGWAASPGSYVAFEGRTRWGRDSRIPFQVASRDWQESDRVLAAILTVFGAPSRAVPIGGFGTFNGTMTGDFSRPRVEGRFVSDATRAFDVVWGHAEGNIVVENAYVDVTDGLARSADSHIDVTGRFSLGYPRRDGGEEINARVRVERWPVTDLRHAFVLDDYPVTGALSGEFHVYDRYERPQGFGRVVLEEAVAYGEPFESARAGVRFDAEGIRLDGLEISKSSGTVTGAALVGWEGTYSFNALGQRVPVESIVSVAYPRAPFSGTLQFTASGAGTFDAPRYEVRGRVEDLFIADEGIGQVTGRLIVRGKQLTVDQLEAASPRLAVSGGGRIDLEEGGQADLTLRFTDTSLDPYVRAFRPKLSPLTTLIASGTLRVFGDPSVPETLRAAARLEQAELRLVDYRMRNDGAIQLVLEDQRVRVERLRVVGEGTQFEMFGDIDLDQRRIALRGLGDANLGILQGFFRDIRSSGAAELQVDLRGTFERPILYGGATITGGRLRHFSLPHALDAVTGEVRFDQDGIRLDGLRARLGGGDVEFGGRVGFRGFNPAEFSVSAVGTGMRLRYPAGFRSVVDADLALRGPMGAPVLAGTVEIKSATWGGPLDDTSAGLFEFATLAGGDTAGAAVAPPSAFPVRFDVRIVAPSTLRIEGRLTRLVSSAELTLRGTYDRPLLFGRVEVDRGQVFVEGNRYDVTRGVIDFANPSRIEPFFDVEAETRVRAPGQVYQVVFRASGTPNRMAFDLSSDPPLSTVDIVSLLFGDSQNLQDAEIGALRSPNRREQDLVAARAARLLASPISSEVGRVVEQTLGVDSVQITPSLSGSSTDESTRLTPAARLTLGKRVSDRLYLTYSRVLNASTRDQIILVEFTQSERISWLVSQNEDRSYSVNFRVRHVF